MTASRAAAVARLNHGVVWHSANMVEHFLRVANVLGLNPPVEVLGRYCQHCHRRNFIGRVRVDPRERHFGARLHRRTTEQRSPCADPGTLPARAGDRERLEVISVQRLLPDDLELIDGEVLVLRCGVNQGLRIGEELVCDHVVGRLVAARLRT